MMPASLKTLASPTGTSLFVTAVAIVCDACSVRLLNPDGASAALPHLHPELRRKLLQSLSEAAATASGWSMRQPAFYPAWVEKVEAGAPMQQMLGLSAVLMLMTFVVFVAYGLLAHAFRVCVIDSPRVQDVLRRTFAASFAGLGAHLALSER